MRCCKPFWVLPPFELIRGDKHPDYSRPPDFNTSTYS